MRYLIKPVSMKTTPSVRYICYCYGMLVCKPRQGGSKGTIGGPYGNNAGMFC